MELVVELRSLELKFVIHSRIVLAVCSIGHGTVEATPCTMDSCMKMVMCLDRNDRAKHLIKSMKILSSEGECLHARWCL